MTGRLFYRFSGRCARTVAQRTRRPEFLDAALFYGPQITWRAFGEIGHEFDLKRFWRLGRACIFEAFSCARSAERSAHLVQMFDSTAARAHVIPRGQMAGKTIRRSAVRVAASQPKSSRSTSTLPLAFQLTGRSHDGRSIESWGRHRTRYCARRHHRPRYDAKSIALRPPARIVRSFRTRDATV